MTTTAEKIKALGKAIREQQRELNRLLELRRAESNTREGHKMLMNALADARRYQNMKALANYGSLHLQDGSYIDAGEVEEWDELLDGMEEDII